MTAANAVFLLLVVLAASFFAYNVQRLARYMYVAGPDDRSDSPFFRIWNVLRIGIAQSKILRDPIAGASHAFVFWGFIVITAGTVEILVHGVWPAFTYQRILPDFMYAAFLLSQDAFALFVLGAVSYLLYRRLVIKPARLQGDDLEHWDALFILSTIALLMITLLLTGAFEAVASPHTANAGRLISNGIAMAFGWMSPEAAHTGYLVNWWAHALLVLAFLNYLPYSKHLHVVSSLFNVYFSNTSGPGQKGVMRAMDLEAEDADTFGAADIEQLTWKNILDGYSCTECGRCTAACPANLTGKVLSPRKIVVNVRQRTMEKAPVLMGDAAARESLVHGEGTDAAGNGVALLDHRLLDHYITDEELWQCTSCRACVTECPVSIDQLDVINQMRRHLVLSESRFPDEVQPVFESMERNGAPWAFSPSERASWAEGLDIPTVAEMHERGERPDLLFWVGCMGSFDDRAKRTTVALARIMKAARLNFAILGQEESCNGDPARRLGNEYLYQMLASQTIETLDRYEVKTIVTFCPHCFHQIGNEYPQLGGNYEVIHHSTLIERLLEEERLDMRTDEGRRLTIAYHDSCYLGRYNDVYDAPREALRRALPVVTVAEPPRTRDRGLCCGAGGGRMWMEETQGKRINVERTEELLATGADALAVACPFCMTMIGDGLKAKESEVPLYDIAEVVADRLRV